MASSNPISRISTLLHTVPDFETVKEQQNIRLVDHTKPQSVEHSAERAPSAASTADHADPTASTQPLYKRLTNNSLSLQESVRQQLAKQKYARYRRDRYTDSTDSTKAPEDDPANAPQPGEEASPAQLGYLERGRAKAKSMLKRKRTMGRHNDQDTAIDILYENQRGSFLFGIPRFSASTLLPSDPRPWQNSQFRTSPVSILNAQPPDPGWEWVWKSWYVDMSRDVDEEGWEYSFMFRKEFNWHGNHPWFHSFVRRRRWVRLRRRKGGRHETKEKGHQLTAEYFTIHPKTVLSGSEGAGSRLRSGQRSPMSPIEPVEKMEVVDISGLANALRKASVDREKLLAVRKFIDSGGEELYYLAERMPEIMNRFMYQMSRRQLLGELLSHHEDAHKKQDELAGHDHTGDEKKLDEHGAAVRRADNLHRAVLAAEDQVRRLEYWSDIKEMAREEELLHPEDFQDADEGGHPEESFQNKQGAHEKAPTLHNYPEHSAGKKSTAPSRQSSKSVSYDTATTKPAPSKQSSHSDFYDAATGTTPATSPPNQQQRKPSSQQLGKSPDSSEDSNSLDRYTTATEGESDRDVGGKPMSPAQKGKEKAAKLSSLDGLMDEAAEDSEGHQADETKDRGAEEPDEEDRARSPPTALSGRGAGGADEVAVHPSEAAEADVDNSNTVRLLAPEPDIDEGDIVEEENGGSSPEAS